MVGPGFDFPGFFGPFHRGTQRNRTTFVGFGGGCCVIDWTRSKLLSEIGRFCRKTAQIWPKFCLTRPECGLTNTDGSPIRTHPIPNNNPDFPQSRIQVPP